MLFRSTRNARRSTLTDPNCAGFNVCITVEYKPSQGSFASLVESWNRTEDVSEYESESGYTHMHMNDKIFTLTQAGDWTLTLLEGGKHYVTAS